MEKLFIKGPASLEGEVSCSGSKNALLPIMAASLLTENTMLSGIPDLRDVRTMIKLFENLGVQCQFEKGKLFIGNKIKFCEANYDLVKTMRASISVLGPLLARMGEASISLPGGCAIGARPIDIHLMGLEKLGAKFKLEQGYVRGTCSKLKGSNVLLPFPSVGATENIMSAAVLAEGVTRIQNAAMEPEIEDLANFLISIGAQIEGAGTPNIVIKGVKDLKSGVEYKVIPDRVEAATLIIAGLMTRSKIKVCNLRPDHILTLTDVLKGMGADLEIGNDFVLVKKQKHELEGFDISTAPYPGFPTDMQAQMMALAVTLSKPSMITEHIFENRFMHVSEMGRIGANISLKGHTAFIKKSNRLTSAPVMCTDLRASAALVLLALCVEGITEIRRIYHLDRGYEKIDSKLRSLGAEIERVHVAGE